MMSRMRTVVLPAAGLIIVLSCGTGHAQVSVDPRALAPLSPDSGAAAPETPARKPPARVERKPAARSAKSQSHPTPAGKPTVTLAPPPPPPVAAPVVPLAPPPPPVIPPPIAVPVRPNAPPPPPAIADDAPTDITPIEDGLRVTFGAGRADLSPAAAERLRGVAKSAAPDASFTLIGYAKGVPEDPSSPRRLSLARVLTLRSLLMGEGVPSIRIFAKALGAGGLGFGDGPPDRADILIGHVDTTPAQTVPAITTPPKATAPAIPVPSTSAPPPATRPAP
jgi:outer membrane protein OmpA-like peptidoglycan-associated protein